MAGSTFQAAVLRETGAPLSIEPLTLAPLEPGDVLIRMHAAGLCHTDREAMTGAFAVPPPVVLGHEGAGVVEAVGSAVQRVKPGQHVVCTIYAACGQCYYCRRDQPMLCDMVVPNHRAATLSSGRKRLRDAAGAEVGHFLSVSSFAEYAVVPEAAAIPVPDDIPFDRACLLGCSVITGVGAALRVARVGLGDSVVVVGSGPVGLNVVQGARLAGAGVIIAVDRRADKLERAAAFGATHTMLGGEDLAAQVRAITGGRGADHAFEAAGVIGSLQDSVDCTRPGGSVTILGKTDPNRLVELRFGSISGERRILRSSLGGAKAADDFPAYAQAYLDGRLCLDELIDRRLPLGSINEAFEDVERGDVIRAVVVMHE
ncbi:S-(hydroxymethyl)glutathione dehydrogenase / alcohol dehydrogenase [Azospirillum oryzae]|uniref:S-(Hydroxymethyl)glutathione dehydrogenase / alcohol dehydrogenase n=1 Tax=Azospirillum oryzae TaxID=286727 RepID=A0A1X7HLM1_9PROT|nr:alcohol dehydrogenase catalytic domain-containing protein [Azospirillum oryzae]SMF88518.1 S-(hydroxymethyl)glutathione dehydrogenase / alcohol dehydrogenase [Azospirillum oryzae]